MPFISLSLLYRRRVTLVFVLLSALAFTFLAIDLRHSYDETAARSYRVFDKVRNFGAGQIPDAFRPSTYLGTTTVKEPTTREEWESFAATIEGEGEERTATNPSRWEDLKQWFGNLVYRVSIIPDYLHRGHSTQYSTDWDDLPPNIKAFKDWEFARGMVHQGTGERTKRFLEKARSGRGVVVSVVGGSVSKGRGLPVHEYLQPEHPKSNDKRNLAEDWHIDHRHSVSQNLYNPLNLHHQIFQFINRTFPATSHSSDGLVESGYRRENVFINGAQGGVGSDYFAGCWKEHIPEDSDLVLVDLGINDIRDLSSMENYELLLRSILEMDSQPAVLNLQPFSLLFSTLSSASSLHIDVAAYYDTPVISIRDIVLPRILNDGTRRTSPGGGAGVGLEIVKWFRNVPQEELVKGDAKNVYVAEADSWVDLMHISQHGHNLLAEMAIHYLQLQIQLLSPFDVHGVDSDSFESAASTHSVSDSNETAEHQETTPKPVLTDIPGMLLASHYSTHKPIRRSNPSCRSTNSAFREERLRLDGGGVNSHGPWFEYTWGEKHYLVTKEPGSRISIPFNVTAPAFHRPGRSSKPSDIKEKTPYRGHGQGYVKIGHLRSNVLGLGSLDCWAEQDPETGNDSTPEKHRYKGTREFPTRVDGWWDSRERNQGVLTTIAEDLLPGSYTLHCTLLEQTLDPGGGTEFRLIAVVYD